MDISRIIIYSFKDKEQMDRIYKLIEGLLENEPVGIAVNDNF